jgi:two-component system, NarL family, sensor histidine kinase DesK
MTYGEPMRTVLGRLMARGARSPGSAGAPGADDRSPGWFELIVVPAIVATYAVGMPVWSFGRVLAGPHRTSAVIAAGLAMAGSVVLQLWLLVPAARGERPRHPAWLVAAFVAINGAAFPLIGAEWFAAGEQLAVLAAVYLRLRWSVPVIAVLAAAPAVMAAAGQDEVLGRYFAQNTVFWALTIGLLIGLARAAVRLRARRHELAAATVIAERVRMNDELSASVGAELERLVVAEQRAARLVVSDRVAAERELRALSGAARAALAQTRRMASHYQAITVRSELTTAVALLTAAGIPAGVEVPAAVLDRAMDSARLAGFRSGLTTALLGQDPGGYLIAADGADGADGEVQLVIRPVRGEP